MKKSFSARRVPRKIGHDDDEDDFSSRKSPSTNNSAESTFHRPTSKPRKASSLRKSIGPTAIDDGTEDDDSNSSSPGSGVVTPRRSNLFKAAIQRNASHRSLLAATLPSRSRGQTSDEDDDRENDGNPSYSAAALRELQDSTPSTPVSFSELAEKDLKQPLDLASKFGSATLSRYQPQQQSVTAIPSATEIAEKKARRARLALENTAEEFISLDPDDPSLDRSDDEDLDENVERDVSGRLILKPKPEEGKYGHAGASGRLERDDEDLMEGFETFTEADAGLTFTKKAEAEERRKRKQEISSRIAEAEADSSDSESSLHGSGGGGGRRREIFEAAQTARGTLSNPSHHASAYEARPRTPPTISPLPTLSSALVRLRAQLAELQTTRMGKVAEMEALKREKVRLAEEEVRVQRALKETAEKFAELRRERGVHVPIAESADGGEDAEEVLRKRQGESLGLGFPAMGGGVGFQPSPRGTIGAQGVVERVLDSLGTSAVGTPVAGEEEDEEEGYSDDTASDI